MQYRSKSNGDLFHWGNQRLKWRAIPGLVREDDDSRITRVEVMVGFKRLPSQQPGESSTERAGERGKCSERG